MQGHVILATSVTFLLVGGWATLLSAFWPHTGNMVSVQHLIEHLAFFR